MDLTPEQRTEFLIGLDKESKDHAKEVADRAKQMTDEEKHQNSDGKTCGTYKRDPQDDPHYFAMMKQLTLLGYFTSKPGATQALRYVAVPGHYEGCIPYKKGDKAWAT